MTDFRCVKDFNTQTQESQGPRQTMVKPSKTIDTEDMLEAAPGREAAGDTRGPGAAAAVCFPQAEVPVRGVTRTGLLGDSHEDSVAGRPRATQTEEGTRGRE